jgi:hypothetical protein
MNQYSENIEVLVNNDSSDIKEIFSENVKYFYEKFDSISEIYEFLLKMSKGKYIYFLEDDDYLTEDFLNQKLDSDIIAGNYCPTYKPNKILDLMNMFQDSLFFDRVDFIKKLNLEHLQLGQFIFKKDVIEDFVFEKDNNVHNDIKLVYHASLKCKTFKTTSKFFYYQTIDGNDNISFPNTIKNISVTASMDFLKNYEI